MEEQNVAQQVGKRANARAPTVSALEGERPAPARAGTLLVQDLRRGGEDLVDLFERIDPPARRYGTPMSWSPPAMKEQFSPSRRGGGRPSSVACGGGRLGANEPHAAVTRSRLGGSP